MRKLSILFISFISAFVFWRCSDQLWMLPLKLWAIAWHESFHALAAWVTGGQVSSVDFSAREGVTWTRGGFYPLISAAGYVGTALLGGLWLYGLSFAKGGWLTRMFILAPWFLMPLFNGIGVLFSLSWWALGVFSISLAWACRVSSLLPWVGATASGFLAVTSLHDIEVYLLSIPEQTDAGLLAKWMGATWLTMPIACFYAALSLGIWLFFVWIFLKRLAQPENPENKSHFPG